MPVRVGAQWLLRLLLLLHGIQPICPLWPLNPDINKIFSTGQLLLTGAFPIWGPSSVNPGDGRWSCWCENPLAQQQLCDLCGSNTLKVTESHFLLRSHAWAPREQVVSSQLTAPDWLASFLCYQENKTLYHMIWLLNILKACHKQIFCWMIYYCRNYCHT